MLGVRTIPTYSHSFEKVISKRLVGWLRGRIHARMAQSGSVDIGIHCADEVGASLVWCSHLNGGILHRRVST